MAKRVNRALARCDCEHEDAGRVLRRARGWRMRLDVGGEWYLVDTRINMVVPYEHVDLELLARELNVLDAHEQLAAE